MPRPCAINCDEIHTIAISLVDNQIAALGADKMQAVADAVRFALDVECG
jgi:mRNA-degrading endonuclease toxin of MazEF toxin-antitoxin module